VTVWYNSCVMLASRRDRRRARGALVAALCMLAAGFGVLQVQSTADAEAQPPPGPRTEVVAAPFLDKAALAAPFIPKSLPPVPTARPEPALPADVRYAGETTAIIGTIEIPAIGLADTLYQGISLTSIDNGPSHWPGTAMPGHAGNTVVAGHRVTRTRPFRDLDQLGPGDVAILTTAEGAFTYEFVSQEIVTPDRVDIVNQHQGYNATFFACHPPGSARYRIVVSWRLVTPPVPG